MTLLSSPPNLYILVHTIRLKGFGSQKNIFIYKIKKTKGSKVSFKVFTFEKILMAIKNNVKKTHMAMKVIPPQKNTRKYRKEVDVHNA